MTSVNWTTTDRFGLVRSMPSGVVPKSGLIRNRTALRGPTMFEEDIGCADAPTLALALLLSMALNIWLSLRLKPRTIKEEP